MTKMRERLDSVANEIERAFGGPNSGGWQAARRLLSDLATECHEENAAKNRLLDSLNDQVTAKCQECGDLGDRARAKDEIIHMKDDRIDRLLAKQHNLTKMWKSRVDSVEHLRKQEKAAYKKLSQTCSRKDAANTELNARLAEQIRANKGLRKAAAEPAVEVEWSVRDMAADGIVQRLEDRVRTLEGALKVERIVTQKKFDKVQKQRREINQLEGALNVELAVSRERGQAIEDLRTKLRLAEDETALKREKSMLAQWCVDKDKVIWEQNKKIDAMREQVGIMDGAQVKMVEEYERLKDTVQRGRDSLKARAQEIERLMKRCDAKDTNIEHLRFLLRNMSDEVGRVSTDTKRTFDEAWHSGFCSDSLDDREYDWECFQKDFENKSSDGGE